MVIAVPFHNSVFLRQSVEVIHGNKSGAVEEAHQPWKLVGFPSQILETVSVGGGTLVDVIDKRAELTEIRSEGIVTAQTSYDENSKNSAEIQNSQNANDSQRYKNQRQWDTQSKMLLNKFVLLFVVLVRVLN